MPVESAKVVRVLAVKRMRHRVGVFIAAFAVVALLTGLSLGLSSYSESAASAGIIASINELAGGDGGFRVSTPLADDAAAQDAAVRATIEMTVQIAGRPLAMTVRRDVVTLHAIPLTRVNGEVLRASVASIPDLPAGARLIAGSWPRTARQASIQADAAAVLHVAVGDRLALPNGDAVAITGTWRVRSATDPRWLEDPVALSGVSVDSTPGWVVIDSSEWKAVEKQPVARWTVRPVASDITVAELSVLQGAQRAVPDAIQRQNPEADVRTEGRLQTSLLPIQQRVQSTVAVTIAPLLALAFLSLITLVELSGVLRQLRSSETVLVAARGASRLRFVGEAIGEALVICVPGGALGLGAAAALLRLQGVTAKVELAGWCVAFLIVLTAVVVFAVSAAQGWGHAVPFATGRLSRMLPSGRGRMTATASLGAVLLVILLAAVATSQFLLYGSPLTPVAGGGLAVDPLAVSALGLLSAAAALLAVTVFPLIARGLERLARTRTGLSSLSLRQVARRPRAALTPVLVLAFGVSGLIVSACYAGTWSTSATETLQAQVGTSVRISFSSPLPASVANPVIGQIAAAPVAREDVQLGNESVSVLGVPADRIGALVNPVKNAIDPAGLATPLRSTANRPIVPIEATGLRIGLAAVPVAERPTGGSINLVDAVGTETAVNLSTDATEGLSGTLPRGVKPWTIHGISLVFSAPERPASGVSIVLDLHATGGSSGPIALDSSWKPSTADLTDQDPTGPTVTGLVDGRAGFHIAQSGSGGAVFLQSVESDPARLPVVISQHLAHATGLRSGSTATMLLVNRRGSVPVVVARVVPIIPGLKDGDGILADLGALQDAAVREGLLEISSREWWIAATDVPRVAAVERAAQRDANVFQAVPSGAERALGATRVVTWVAGITTALLAFLVTGTGLYAELRSRRKESLLLRALGVSSRSRANKRVAEWLMLTGIGFAAGVFNGAVLCLLLVPQLARTAVPDAIAGLPTRLSLDLVGAATSMGGVMVAILGLLLILYRYVRSDVHIHG